jgi:hypothetical protein
MDIDLFDAFEGASAPTQPRRRSGANSTSASAGGPGSGVSQKRKLETNSHEGDVGANDASSAHVPVSSNRSGLDKRHRTEADDAASSMEIMGAQQVTSGPSAGAGTLVSIDPSTLRLLDQELLTTCQRKSTRFNWIRFSGRPSAILRTRNRSWSQRTLQQVRRLLMCAPLQIRNILLLLL